MSHSPRPLLDLPLAFARAACISFFAVCALQAQADEKEKPEGAFLAGFPILYRDETLGNGYGAAAALVDNGERTELAFEQRPFLYAAGALTQATDRGFEAHEIFFAWNRPGHSPWSGYADGTFSRDINALYFGRGEETMRPLRHHALNNPELPVRTNVPFEESESRRKFVRTAYRSEHTIYEDLYAGHVSAGEAALALAWPRENDARYYRYEYEAPSFHGGLSRSFPLDDGGENEARHFGLALGVFGTHYRIRKYDGRLSPGRYLPEAGGGLVEIPVLAPGGPTKLSQDIDAGKVVGGEGGKVNAIRLGAHYDSRDRIVDPRSGFFSELTVEGASSATGSEFTFARVFTQTKLFFTPSFFENLTLGSRAGLVISDGGVPFFIEHHIWSTETANFLIQGLGGSATLRGFRQPRFVGRVMGLASLEARWRIARFALWKYDFELGLVPFYDTGRVWDRPDRVGLADYAFDYGTGLRLLVNGSFMIVADYAVSREDRALNIKLWHAF